VGGDADEAFKAALSDPMGTVSTARASRVPGTPLPTHVRICNSCNARITPVSHDAIVRNPFTDLKARSASGLRAAWWCPCRGGPRGSARGESPPRRRTAVIAAGRARRRQRPPNSTPLLPLGLLVLPRQFTSGLVEPRSSDYRTVGTSAVSRAAHQPPVIAGPITKCNKNSRRYLLYPGEAGICSA
jgi:hypothetical protein